MAQKVPMECPKCGRSLQNFDGHIGRCSQHHWVSPIGLGFESEATEKNKQDTAVASMRLLDEERQKAEDEAQIKREQHATAVRKAVSIVVAICLVVAAIAFFIVRPSVNYNGAIVKFLAGNYAEAMDAYTSLGDYKDAAARVALCSAMIDLHEGRTEDAAQKLEQLTSNGTGDIATPLADALIPIMSDWKEKGLTPQALLHLLGKADVIDPNGALDVAILKTQAHTAMLDGHVLSSYADDVDGDGDPELITLGSDYAVTVYRMAPDGNVRVAVDNETVAAYGMRFGDAYKETNVDASVACYAESYRLLPNNETRSALSAAYRLRAAEHENADDMATSIVDARSAMDTSSAADDFTFFYDINLRNCKNGHDAATAISMWDEFAAGSAAEIARFGARDRWKSDAALLHVAHAAELAARKDESCIAELRRAAEMGADLTVAIAEAQSHFEPGFALAHLRLFEIELLGSDSGKADQIHDEMADEVRTAIKEWKSRGIAPSDVPALIVFADVHVIDLSGIDRDAIYEETALTAVGAVAQCVFVDWDQDGYKELLTLDKNGKLSLYKAAETWSAVSTIETKMPASSYEIADETAPLILVISDAKDELLALTCANNQMSTLFREEGISRYAKDGPAVTFSRLLAGSIERFNDYAYEAVGTANRPVRVGIDWQQNDYPQPAGARDAVQRYFEARAYDIPEEAKLLLSEPSTPTIFDAVALSALAIPDVPGTVEAKAYQTEADEEHFEVVYSSDAQRIRTWVAAEYIDGWKLIGAADTYGAGLDPADVDYSVPLISLNAETTNAIAGRGNRNTYRLLIPSAGRLSLMWQSGDKATSRTAYVVSLYRDTLAGDAIIAYELQPSAARQQTKPMFMSAGVYYVTVEARIDDAPEYHLTMLMDEEMHVELEPNDVPTNATPVELNSPYYGSLLTSGDIDFYTFTLDAIGAVNVTLGTPGNGSKATTHTYAVMNAASGAKLTTANAPGNVQLSATGNLYLAPGDYLVQVNKGGSWVNDEYTLTVNVTHEGTMESELNNTPETANAVPLNEDIHASIGQEGDIDYYSFTLDGDTVVQPRFTFKPTDSASKTYVLTIIDGNRYELLTCNIGGKESTKVIPPAALPKGTYTVKIENPRYIKQDYTLRLVSMGVAASEQEPNDSAARATDLTMGAARTGVISSDDDIDYYKLDFMAQTAVTFKFSFAQTTSTNTAYVLTIEQNGKTQWTANVKGDSGGIEQQLQFPAGEYFMRIKPSNWTSAVYTIGIK